MVDKQKQQNEVVLFNSWKKSQSIPDFQALYTSMKPLIVKAAKASAYGSNIPQSAHQAYATQAFYNSLGSYDPSKGAALGTHVWNSVNQKTKRLNATFGNLGKIPEHRIWKIGEFQTVVANLTAQYGREPTIEEVMDETHLSRDEIIKLRVEIKQDLALSDADQDRYVTSEDEYLLHYVQDELTPDEKRVFDYIFGKNGKPQLITGKNKPDFDRIAIAAGFSPSKVRGLHKTLEIKLEKALKQ